MNGAQTMAQAAMLRRQVAMHCASVVFQGQQAPTNAIKNPGPLIIDLAAEFDHYMEHGLQPQGSPGAVG